MAEKTIAGPLLQALLAQRAGLAAYVERRMPDAIRGAVDPADVVQDVCCEAIRYEAKFVALDGSSARRWLFTVARNRMSALLASQMRWGTVAAVDPLVNVLDEMARYERTPSTSAMSHETWFAIRESLGRLPPQYAGVIQSRYIDRVPAADLATTMGRTAAAVDQMLHRAMAALRVELRSLVAAHA